MRKKDDDYLDPDDMFADTRMSFGDHIEDLRRHLILAVAGFLVGMLVSLAFGKPVLRFIAEPVETQLAEFQKRYNLEKEKEIREKLLSGEFKNIKPVMLDIYEEKNPGADGNIILAHLLPGVENMLEGLGIAHMLDLKPLEKDSRWIKKKIKIDPIPLALEMRMVDPLVRPPSLTTLRVEESFFVYFKVALMTGLVISSPWVFYQIWAFVAAGLYPHEKRLVNVYLPFSLFLFLLGVGVCQFLVIPKAIEALLWFNEWLGFQPELRLNEWLGFAIFMPLVFGLSFQTPIVMLFLEKIGVFRVENYRNKRRIAWFLLAIFAAIITPSTDAFSMLFLWVPMSLLYELGILLCLWSPRQEYEEESDATQHEMVEV